jgi:hypothetical protein
MITWFAVWILGYVAARARAQECPAYVPNFLIEFPQQTCVEGTTFTSAYGEVFDRRMQSTLCEPGYGPNNQVFPAAYPGMTMTQSEVEPRLSSQSTIRNSSMAWLFGSRAVNLTLVIKSSYHRTVYSTASGVRDEPFRIATRTDVYSDRSFIFERTYFSQSVLYYYQYLEGTGLVPRTYTDSSPDLAELYPNPGGSTFDPYIEIIDVLSWHNPVVQIMTIDFNSVPSRSNCNYLRILSSNKIYKRCVARGGLSTTGLVLNSESNKVYMFLDTTVNSDNYINTTVYGIEAYDRVFSDAEIIAYLSRDDLIPRASPVVRNASINLPQGPSILNWTTLVFDGEGRTTGQDFLFSALPTLGVLQVVNETGAFNLTSVPATVRNATSVYYRPFDNRAFNVANVSSVCTTPYDAFTYKVYTPLPENDLSPLAATVHFCLYDQRDVAVPVNSSLEIKRGDGLKVVDILYSDADDFATGSAFAALNNGISVAFKSVATARSRLVFCANSQPVGVDEYIELTQINGTRRRLTTVCVQLLNNDYFDLGVDDYPFSVKEVGEDDSGEVAYLAVSIVTSLSDTPLSVTFDEAVSEYRINLTWVDSFGFASSDDFNVTVDISWIVPSTSTVVLATPPQDYFNVRPDGTTTTTRLGAALSHPAPLVVTYTVYLQDVSLFTSTFNVRVKNVFSPIRVSPTWGIPSGTLNVTNGAFTDLPLGTLLDILDPDEDEFNVGVSMTSSSSLIYFIFPNLSRAEQRNTYLTYGTCDFDWQFRGCADFTLVGPASLVNLVMSKAKLTAALSTTRATSSVRMEVFKPSPTGILQGEASGTFAVANEPNFTFVADLQIASTDSGGTASGATSSFWDVFQTILQVVAIGTLALVVMCSPCLFLLCCALYFPGFLRSFCASLANVLWKLLKCILLPLWTYVLKPILGAPIFFVWERAIKAPVQSLRNRVNRATSNFFSDKEGTAKKVEDIESTGSSRASSVSTLDAPTNGRASSRRWAAAPKRW